MFISTNDQLVLNVNTMHVNTTTAQALSYFLTTAQAFFSYVRPLQVLILILSLVRVFESHTRYRVSYLGKESVASQNKTEKKKLKKNVNRKCTDEMYLLLTSIHG